MKLNKGDVLKNVDSGIIAHGCNCQGVMGAGIAKSIKIKFPDVYKEYASHCKTHIPGSILLGTALICNPSNNHNLRIANCFTQIGYQGHGSDIEVHAQPFAIKESLKRTSEYASSKGITEIHMPKIGCGLGGLTWDGDVEPIVDQVEKTISEYADTDFQFIIWEL